MKQWLIYFALAFGGFLMMGLQFYHLRTGEVGDGWATGAAILVFAFHGCYYSYAGLKVLRNPELTN
ncbi:MULTISPECIES: hypothetical protein [Halorussus]|uniref:hypothetical protein n=1 Tax=Halorussus TaxID=1070314 RepID=UPI0020A03F97|nr:hypothetical protein [Halorussus vallis]USZ74384.1 hypothetical protein NGM07_13125 [Halorussus vallis]